MNQVTLNQPGEFSFSPDGPAPVAKPGDAIVKVHRIGVCGTDLHAYSGNQPFFEYPRVLGHELGVEVIDPGTDPRGLKVGDRCSVEPYMNCGTCIACRRGKPNCCTSLNVLGVHGDGGMGELLAVPTRKLHRSEKLSYDQLALIETLGIGAHAVERAEPSAEDFILVIGAGPIGLSVIQFALITGATVAVMDISESRLAFCREQLGVKHTVVAGETAADQLMEIGGDLPTVVIDATGNPRSMAGAFDLPANGGRIVFVGLFQGELAFNDPNFHRRELTVCASRNALPETFSSIIAAMEEGRIDTTPWITHRLALAEVPEKFDGISKDKTLLKCMIEV
ncbi:MAG: zinc-binding alcohol dehydrogenase family protein [Synoicihabitans sp.]